MGIIHWAKHPHKYISKLFPMINYNFQMHVESFGLEWKIISYKWPYRFWMCICVISITPLTCGKSHKFLNPTTTFTKTSPLGHLIWILHTTMITYTNSHNTKWIVDLPCANIPPHWKYFAPWTSLQNEQATCIPIGIAHL